MSLPSSVLPAMCGALSLAGPVLAADWRPASPRLLTVWGEQVTPANAWREYPRPQFVRDAWFNLNGLWDYAITPQTAAAPARYEGQILVPFALESALSGVGRPLAPDQRLWYRRTFALPAAWAGRRVQLNLEAVDYASTVWLNGALVGSHTGGSDAFSFDLTALLRPGDNELVVAVTDPTDSAGQPRGKQKAAPAGIWYTPVSGIWQTVWLEPVPDIHLAELRLTPDVPRGGLHVAALADAGARNLDDHAVRVTASAQGRTVATGQFRVNREGFLPVPAPHLWTPDDPFLYDLQVELVNVDPAALRVDNRRVPRFDDAEAALYAAAPVRGAPLDSVRSYFALREMTLGPGPVAGQPSMLLNGRPVFLHGPLDQGWWPESLLTPPADAAMIWEIEWLKRAGFNSLRKHIKVEPARYYYHCDRLGLTVWQDMPSGYTPEVTVGRADRGEALRPSANAAQHEFELRRMLDRLHHHPCIVMWVIHNEGWGQYRTAALAGWVKALDPSRLVNAASGWRDVPCGDLFDAHDYAPLPAPVPAHATRAIVLGEYGGVGLPVEGHLWNPQMRNWGYQTYRTETDYRAATGQKIAAAVAMHRSLGLSGAIYTQTTDVEGEVNGFLTYDRRVEKITPAELAALNRGGAPSGPVQPPAPPAAQKR